MKSNIDEKSLEPSGELAVAIHDFHSAVTHVADRETTHQVPADWLAPARKRRRRAQQSMVLAWACAVLFCLAMLPLSMDSHHAAVQHVAQTSAATVPAPESDSALLEQVDTNVSESVPSPLAPLAELQTWSSASANTSSDSSANGASPAHMEKTNVTH
jgi:hypothetical protein